MLGSLILDWILPLGLVAGLVIVVRLRQTFFKVNDHAYHFVSSGLGFLALAVVLRLYHNGGLLSNLPFVSDHIFYRLIFWSAITAGCGLIVSGLSTLTVDAVAARRSRNTRIVGLELIRTVERLLAVEPRLNILLSTSADHLASTYGATCRAAYRRFPGTETFARLDSSTNTVDTLFPSDMQADEVARMISHSEPHNSLVLPIRYNGSLEAVIALQLEQPLSPNDRTNIAVVGEILAHRLEMEMLNDRIDAYQANGRLERELRLESRRADSAARLSALIMNKVRSRFDIDLVSLCFIQRHTNRMTRQSIGATGAMLTEKGLPIPSGLAEQLVDADRTAIRVANPIEDTSAFGLPGNMLSAVAVTCRRTSRGAMILMLASAHRHPMMEDLSGLEFLAPLTSDLFSELWGRQSRLRLDRRIGRIQRILNRELTNHDLEAVGSAIARLLQHELKVDVVRLISADQSPTFFKTVGVAYAKDVLPIAEELTVLRSHLRIHEEVIASGIPKWLNASRADLMISVAEAQAVLTSPLGAVAIVPIPSEKGVIGTVSIASGTGHGRLRYSREERQFVTLVAQLVGMVLSLDRQSQNWSGWSITRNSDRQLRSRMKSSLSGILGSLELIRKGETSGSQVEHYLGIIDSSARRINDYLTNGSTDTSVREREEENVLDD